MLEKAQILTALFWDGTLTQAEIDEVAHKRMGLDPNTSFAMAPPDKPADWVPTSSLPMPTRTVMVGDPAEEMVVGKDGKLTPVEHAQEAKTPPPPPHAGSGSQARAR